MARANDGELELLYAERGRIGSAESRTREIVLEGLTREVNIAGGQVHILAGDPEAALPEFAKQRDYDVLVLGALTHRQGLAPLVGTLTSKLAEGLDCDIVLVKPKAASLPVPIRQAV